jgi:crotonobetainyl-CoA:carnitine CoA-transferase CaiB-like acyl-CoA transferase
MFIDASMVEPSMTHIGEAIMDYTINQRIQHSLGNRDISMSPQGCYRCQGEDEWVTISVCSDEEWQRLTKAMGNSPLARDARFGNVLGRLGNQDELDRLIEAWTMHHNKIDVMYKLQKAGIAAGAVVNSPEVYNDPQIKERGFLDIIEDPDAGVHTYPGRLWKLNETEVPKRTHAPCLGEHNHYVLKEIVGLTPEEITELEKERIIGNTPIKAL